MRRPWPAVALCALLGAFAAPVLAADEPLALDVDGRPVSRSASVAVMRGDVAFVDVIDLVRVFNGLVTLRGTAVTASVGGHEATFRPSDAMATVDGTAIAMQAAAFRQNGDLYVPLAFFVDHIVPGTTLRLERNPARATLHVLPAAPGSAAPAPAATPATPATTAP